MERLPSLARRACIVVFSTSKWRCPARTLGGVVAARVKWVAPTHTDQPANRSGNGPITTHGLDEVLATGRLKPALWTEQGAKGQLIQTNHPDKQRGWYFGHVFQEF